MFLNELKERRVVVIFCGRFQPFHRGHAIVYNNLVSTYGRNNVYIGTSGKVEPPNSPFTLSDRIYFMNLMGIPSDRVLQLSNNYNPTVAAQALGIQDLNNTVMIFPVSQKDVDEKPSLFSGGTKKDGSPKMLQPLPQDQRQVESADKHAYIQIVDVQPFKVLGKSITGATSIRDEYIKADKAQRQQIIKDLYGKYTYEAEKIMNDNLLPSTPVAPAPLGNKTKLQKVKVPKEEPVSETISFVPIQRGKQADVGDLITVKNLRWPARVIEKNRGSLKIILVGQNLPDSKVNPDLEFDINPAMVKEILSKANMREEATGVGVVKGGKDPRYVMATTGEQNDVTEKTPMANLRAFKLAEEDLAWVRERLGESAVDALAARHIEYINQDIDSIKQRINTEELPSSYVEKLKQKIAELEQERANLALGR